MAVGITEVEQVTTFAQEIAAWIPLINGLAVGALAGGVALLVSRMNHRYAREREEKAAAERRHHELQLVEDKRQNELLFIATELVFLLEEFAEGCAQVAADPGEPDKANITVVTVLPPVIDLTQISGDWRVLPAKLMYRIRELPILLNEAGKHVADAYDNDWPPDYSRTFSEREYQYSRVGLKALFAAIRLRKLAGYPQTRLNASAWSAQPVLLRSWSQARKHRAQK